MRALAVSALMLRLCAVAVIAAEAGFPEGTPTAEAAAKKTKRGTKPPRRSAAAPLAASVAAAVKGEFTPAPSASFSSAAPAETWFSALPEYPMSRAPVAEAAAPAVPKPDVLPADGARFAAGGVAPPAAFFRRGGVYWVVLAAPEADGENELLAHPPAPFQDLRRFPHPSYTVLYGKLKPGTRAMAVKMIPEAGGGSAYVVTAAEQPSAPERAVPVKLFTRKLTGSFVRFGDAPNLPPLRLRDPLVGDQLLILTYPPGKGVAAPGKDFPDFAALPSEQGAALALRSDAVHFEPDGDGVTVAGPADRLVSDVQAALRELQEQEQERDRLEQEARKNTDHSFLKFNDWRGGRTTPFRTREAELMRAFLDAPPEKRSGARLDLARFYFAQGFKTEALNVFAVMRERDPGFADTPQVRVPEGAAFFLAGRYAEAASTLEKAMHGPFDQESDKQEAQFWLDAAKLKLHIEGNLPERLLSGPQSDLAAIVPDAPGAPFRTVAPVPDVISNIEGFLKDYPRPLYDDFALLALEGYLRMNRPVEAETMTGLFDQEDMRPVFRDARSVLEGVFAAKDNREADALDAWAKVAAEPDDRYNRTRAVLLSTLYRYRRQLIDAKQAVEELNKARAGWRGGPEELNILKFLGELYFRQNDFYNGFKVWREAAKRFAGHEDGLLLAKRLSEKFAQIFAAKDNAGTPDLETLTLFYEFRDLTPLGKAGDQIISGLADRLIALDLLDRAAALLEHQARFRLQGKERDEAVFKLADIRMRDRHPEAALEALTTFGAEASDDEAKRAMRYMQARALTELGKNNRVLKLLEGDGSPDAAYLRTDVFWRNSVWKKVASELEPVFRAKLRVLREDKNASLDKRDVRELVRLAVSYALLNRRSALRLLRDDFTPMIPPGSDKNLFDFVTGETASAGLAPEELLGSDNVSSFLSDYLNKSSAPPGEPGQALPSPSTPTPGQRRQTAGG